MRKVYIVDDYKGTREACRLALNDIGFRDEEIYEFGTERAFYEAAEATRPDMVIVDDTLPEACGMHGIDGLGVVKYLNAQFNGDAPDVVMLSELLDKGEAEYMSRFAPRVRIVSKPVSLDEFTRAVS